MRLFLAALALAGAMTAARADDDPTWAFARAGMVPHAVERVGATSARSDRVGAPMRLSGAAMLDEARKFVGMRHSPTGFRGPWCGDFAGFVAARVGASRPRDYRLARAWAGAGVASAPRVGSIAVMAHHVGIVVAVHGRSVELLSGNHSHSVAFGEYPMRRIIAFRQV